MSNQIRILKALDLQCLFSAIVRHNIVLCVKFINFGFIDGEWFGNKGIYYKTCRWTGCGDKCYEGTEEKIGEDFYGDSKGTGCSYGDVKSRCCIANKYSSKKYLVIF